MKSKSKMLARKNSDKTITCLACSRYCRIPNGQAGFCGVRANDNGKLVLSVYGKPCAVWIDPVEKKPLFHFLPGSKSYSIGTFGCDFACDFCFAPDSAIINDDSIKTLGELFEECEEKATLANGEVGFTQNRKTITASGCKKRIKKVFRHFYEGDMLTVHPRHAPSVTCTPEHSFFVYRDADMKKIMAKDLKYNDFLFIPKFKPGNGDNQLDSRQILEKNVSKIKKIRKPGEAKLRLLLKLKEEGKTSRELGKILKTHPSYLRRLSCELKRKGINEKTFYYDNVVVEEKGRIKFKMEKGNGIPEKIDVNEDLAELLGYYCAEGNIHRYSTRPNSFNIVFSYGKHETNLIKRTDKLLRKLFGVAPTILLRRTTTTVEVNKSSLGVLLTALCGHKAKEKKIPSLIARSSDKVIAAFLKAFVAGDDCILKDKIAINTVSKKLALGLYHLFLLSDYLPSFYEWRPPRKKIIEGRVVNQSTLYYVKLQAEKFRERFLGNNGYKLRRKSEENLRFKETKDYWLVPVFKVEKKSYSGYVYNCEVEDEHSYLANFVGVANCQNWDISQAPSEARLRDPKEWRGYFQKLIDKLEFMPPETIVQRALDSGCKSISFTYNEPTIFTEYALDIMKIGKKEGLQFIYVTNGYESRECWDALAPYLTAANIDLKAFNQNFYGKLCKANLEPVKESILYVKKKYPKMWIEITTLLVPGWNDAESELLEETKWLAKIDKFMPWHVTAFHPDYKMQDAEPTKPEMLMHAREIGRSAGLNHVYCGNLGFSYSNYETTACPKCKKELITRAGFSITNNNIIDGKCRFCKEKISGVWI